MTNANQLIAADLKVRKELEDVKWLLAQTIGNVNELQECLDRIIEALPDVNPRRPEDPR